MITELEPNIIERLLKDAKRGHKILQILGKQMKFAKALDSEIGKELLKDLLVMYEVRFEKIVNETANNKDLAEFRICRELLEVWANRISNFLDNIKQLKDRR